LVDGCLLRFDVINTTVLKIRLDYCDLCILCDILYLLHSIYVDSVLRPYTIVHVDHIATDAMQGSHPKLEDLEIQTFKVITEKSGKYSCLSCVT